jgi:uncharacterized protein YjbJ (UPF0337 family)
MIPFEGVLIMAVNKQVLEGNWNEIKGKLRERWGRLSGDELESAHGNVDQLVGAIQRKTGEARASVEGYLEELTSDSASMVSQAAESVRHYADVAKESVQDATAQASEAIRTGYDKTAKTVKKHPMESLAVCFGAGVISGVVLGLVLRR